MSRANRQYPNDLRLKAVQLFLDREGSYQKIAEENNIRWATFLLAIKLIQECVHKTRLKIIHKFK